MRRNDSRIASVRAISTGTGPYANRGGRRSLTALVLSFVLVASGLVAVTGSLLDAGVASASTGVSWGTPSALPGNPTATENWMSCTAPGDCTVVGGNGTSPVATTETAGVWGTTTAVSGFPSGAAFQGVSCTSPGNCVAVGGTTNGTSGSPIDAVETNGVWGDQTTASATGIFLNVSCPGLTSITCQAVGAGGDGYAALGVILASGAIHWYEFDGSNATSQPYARGVLSAISCPSLGNCVAAGGGELDSTSTLPHPIVITLTFNTTTGTKATPSELPYVGVITAASCSALLSCDGLGVYSTDGTYDPGTLTPDYLSETNGSWSANPFVSGPLSTGLTALSCTSPGNCSAVGGTTVSQTGGQLVYANEVSGTWGALTTVPYAAGGGGYFNGLGCASGVCTAVGTDNNGHLLTDTTASISGVTFSGSPSSPTVTVNGSGFASTSGTGAAPSLGTPLAPCGPNPSGNGSDFGGLLYLQDTTHGWSAGQGGTSSSSCSYTGLVLSSYSPTQLVFTMGSTYPTYGTLHAGDAYSVTLLGTSFTGTVVYPSAPTITSAASVTFTENPSQTFTVTTTGAPTPKITESGALPTGVSFVDNGNGTATLSGQPAALGAYPLTITANNGVGAPATQSFVLTVGQAPSITSAASAIFTEGAANSFNVTTTGYPAPSLHETGALPPGVTFVDNGNGSATLSGDPTEPGTYSLNLSASNGVGASPAQQPFTLIVDAINLYAATTATGTGDCLTAADACTLATALTKALPFDAIVLVTPGTSGVYSGGFTVDTPGTSSTYPVVIEDAPGIHAVLDGGGSQTVLTVSGNTDVDLLGVTIQNGYARDGGGIFNNSGGDLYIGNSTFSHNTAGYDGGAIDNADNGSGGQGTVTVENSTFVDNSACYDGGAINNGDNGATGTLIVASSTFSGNTATCKASTFADGGAIDNGDNGGNGTLHLTSSTFAGDSAFAGSDLDNGNHSGVASGTYAGNIFSVGCAGGGSGWIDQGYNVDWNGACLSGGTGDTSDTAIASLLGPLASHGGPTQTIALLAGNPAIGRIPNPTSLCPVIADQRGIPSLSGASCDAGAVQLDPQAITFAKPAPGTVGTTATLSATGGPSGEPVVFKVASTSGAGVCSVSGKHGVKVHFLTTGTCRISASQAGDANYTSAKAVIRTIAVT